MTVGSVGPGGVGPPNGVVVSGYRCEATAVAADRSAAWPLGEVRERDPRLAVRWMRGRALLIANALDPLPGACGPLPAACLREVVGDGPNPGALLRRWADDASAQAAALTRLRTGTPISVHAADDATQYVISAYPLTKGVPDGPSRRLGTATPGRRTASLPSPQRPHPLRPPGAPMNRAAARDRVGGSPQGRVPSPDRAGHPE
ncbi:hypothetical protein JJV70_11280 [Streptomyces sp. JJ66]|uniref:hypothetical protein n=1 Tax=Streptomyces sp. JJ66 TaxID=2803843 RepID=UPI001C5681B2|nr:hypothetical protein [Streptomyces sp. JJ66]MBW1602680.1 hypothetical protein [Streptomyces sp. JJ66]